MAVFWETFFANRTAIEEQYRAVRWRENSGLAPEELRAMADGAMEAETDKALKKARAFACVLDHAQLAVEPAELFQDHIRHDFILQKQRREWEKEAYEGPLRAVAEKAARMRALGAGTANSDFGHTVPDWYDVLALGLPGLLARLREYDDGSAFYRAGTLVYEAAIRYVRRLAASAAARRGRARPATQSACAIAPKTWRRSRSTSRAPCTRLCNWRTFSTFCRRKSRASAYARWAGWTGCISASIGRICRKAGSRARRQRNCGRIFSRNFMRSRAIPSLASRCIWAASCPAARAR